VADELEWAERDYENMKAQLEAVAAREQGVEARAAKVEGFVSTKLTEVRPAPRAAPLLLLLLLLLLRARTHTHTHTHTHALQTCNTSTPTPPAATTT